MAALDINAIYQALFDLLQTELAGSVKLFTRRAEHFENAASQPAMLLLASSVSPSQERGLPPRWRLTGKVIFYVRATENSQSPEAPLFDLVGQLEAALQRKWDDAGVPDQDEWGTTLGGLVSSISLTNVDLEQGVDGGQGLAIVDLIMVTHT
jgi:hypothetical protein